MTNNISRPVKREDAKQKLEGSACYIGDMKLPGMLYAVTVRSTEARARILSIEYPQMPEGYYIVDKTDVPGINRIHMIIDDQPYFAEDIVNYIGEPIALLVGEDETTICELMSQIRIKYEKLEPVFSCIEPTAYPIYGQNNSFADYVLNKGDLTKAKADAKYVYEGTYETGFQEQFYMEPQGVIGTVEEGKVTIYGSMQCPYYIKNALLSCLAMPSDKVRVVQMTTGGAFGGKEDYPSLLAGQVACAAIKTQKPVALLLERTEDLESTTKRHPSCIKLKSYVDDCYRLIGLEADIVLDAGAYSGLSSVVLQRAMFAVAGVYNVENLGVKGSAIATNKAVSGAFRGFGSPQAFFAIEMHMEHAAKEMGIEPIDFKLWNLLKPGDKSTTGGTFRDKILLPQMVHRVKELSGYRSKRQAFKHDHEHNKRRGIGISMFFHGCGFTGNGEQDHIKSKARLVKDAQGLVEILIANVEIGQGAQTVMRKIAAEALEIPIERVVFQNPDTDRVPDSGPTVASRTTVIVGKLIYNAAMELKKKWQPGVVQEAEVDFQYPAGFQWDNSRFFGDAYTNYSWGVNVVEVESDLMTYESRITGVWGVYDIGRSMDDRIVKGQIEGGIVQGLGYASMEVMENVAGRFLQRTAADYMIPTAMDVPPIISELMCEPFSEGPFGAKGLGELSLVGAPIAYALAVENALNRSLCRLPIRPEFLMEVESNES